MKNDTYHRSLMSSFRLSHCKNLYSVLIYPAVHCGANFRGNPRESSLPFMHARGRILELRSSGGDGNGHRILHESIGDMYALFQNMPQYAF